MNQSQTDDLERKIRTWLSELPPDRRPPIERVKVFDWASLCAYLERASRTRDVWLGLGDPRLLAHSDFRSRLSGFRKYLLPEKLPYRPLLDPSLHPAEILASLRSIAGLKGILVQGPGGVGKTRLSFEVAELAHSQNVRVLHALAGEPPLSTENLIQAVLEGQPEEREVLVTFDYLDQMDGLDLGMIQRHLLPAAHQRNIPLMLLANARPGEVDPERSDRALRLGLFEPRKLDLDRDQGEKLSQYVVKSVAPEALAKVGEEQLLQLCGTRPIIAMLIAREVERRVLEGGDEAEAVAVVPPDDLLSWLRVRLRWCGLTVAETVGFRTVEPEPPVKAAASVLAAAPQDEDALRNVALRVVEKPDQSNLVVDQLLALGWLEPDEDELSTPHDVVADEVLDQVLRMRPHQTLRSATLESVLQPAVTMARTLGRYSITLRRLADREENAPSSLSNASRQWLTDRASVIGGTLKQAEPTESAYALGAVLAWPPWLGAAIDRWGQFVAPWLNEYRHHVAARHIFHRGLKYVPSGKAGELSESALVWLDEHGSSEEGSFVLAPLLDRDDLGDRTNALETRHSNGSRITGPPTKRDSFSRPSWNATTSMISSPSRRVDGQSNGSGVTASSVTPSSFSEASWPAQIFLTGRECGSCGSHFLG